MKKTWNFQQLRGDAERALATSPSVAAAARRLGVDASTLFRWLRAGKLSRPARTRQQAPDASVTLPGVSAATWADSVRTSHDVSSRTDEELLQLGELALSLAKDPAQRPADRLAAITKFCAIAKQLALEVPDDGEAETTRDARTWPRRVG